MTSGTTGRTDSISWAVPLHERTIGFQLALRRKDSADRRFVTFGDRNWTFAEADAIARAFARGLHREGVGEGDHVVLMLPNCPEFVFAWFGSALIGAVAVPIDPRLSGGLLRYAIDDARPACLVVAHELLDAVLELPVDLLAQVECLVIVGHSDGAVAKRMPVRHRPWVETLVFDGPDPERHLDHRRTAMVMYTSGSSGAPKGVVMPAAHMFVSGLAMMRAVALRRDDVLFTPFPMFHGMSSRIGVLPALLAGIPVVIDERFSASQYWRRAQACDATIGLIVPTIPALLKAQPASAHDREHRVRAMFNSAADAAFEQRFGTELIESYGMTEIGHVISASYSERRRGCCGRVQPEWDVRVVDDEDRDVPVGETGEIVARPRVPGIMMTGYLNKPEETQRAMRGGWFHTSDFGYVDPDGYFHFTGRKAERIRRLGENISPAEIEQVVAAHPAIAECAALPYPSPVGEDDIRLVVALKPDTMLDAAALFDWISKHLPRFMLPRYVEFVPTMPRTESGKVAKLHLQRTALAADVWDNTTRVHENRAPWLPLRSVRVLDFSLLLPGPFATLALADLGADVVRVEPLQGDFVRKLPVPMFRMSNRNKRSIALDLKHPAARGVVERLTRWADCAIEGFRPGAAARLGIDGPTLRAINPRLVHCSLSGYGQTGPARDAPGHELNYLAAAGSFSLPGHWGEPARRTGIPIADLSGGMFAAIAILAALRERDITGNGVTLDLSLHEAALAITVARTGLELDGEMRAHLWPTNDLFESADGEPMVFGLVEDHLWRNFVHAVRDLAPDLAAPEYATESLRREHGDALHARMHEVIRLLTCDEWLVRLRGCDVPVERVLSPAEAGRSPHVRAREMIMELEGERHLPFPVRANGRRGGALRCLAPALGAHTREVLSEVGYSDAESAELMHAGLFGAASA